MSDSGPAMTFTQIVADLDAQGYNSMGFTIEDEGIGCLDCQQVAALDDVKVGGLLGYATDDGEGLVIVMACPACHAKGMLFAGPDVRQGPNGAVVETLADRARH